MSNRVKVKLVSEADTGYYYTTTKNPRNSTEKLRFKKFDPRAPADEAEGGEGTGEGGEGTGKRGKHVWFKEGKIK